MSANTFSVGIKWEYNDYYKDKNKENYVSPHYANLKSEIMGYEHIENIIRKFMKKKYIKKQRHIIKLN